MSRDVSCRGRDSADGSALVPVLDLGKTPLANRLPLPDQLEESEPTYPLDLAFCPHCTLLQIRETVPPSISWKRCPITSSCWTGISPAKSWSN